VELKLEEKVTIGLTRVELVQTEEKHTGTAETMGAFAFPRGLPLALVTAPGSIGAATLTRGLPTARFMSTQSVDTAVEVIVELVGCSVEGV
jgi:hypothetical protein